MAAENDPGRELVPKLRDPSPQVRAQAAEGLGTTGRHRYAAVLVPLLEDPDAGVKRAAVAALVAVDAASEFPRLLALAGDRDPSIRAEVADAAGWLDRWETVPRLCDLLRDPAPDVRKAALSALGRLEAKTSAGDVARLKVALPEAADRPVPFRIRALGGRMSLLDALEDAMPEFVLEEDEARFQTREEAVAFWNGWLRTAVRASARIETGRSVRDPVATASPPPRRSPPGARRRSRTAGRAGAA